MNFKPEGFASKAEVEVSSGVVRFFANICPCFGKKQSKTKLNKEGDTFTNNGSEMEDLPENKDRDLTKVDSKNQRSTSMLRTASFTKSDQDVEDYFYKKPSSNIEMHKYVSLQSYQSERLFTIGTSSKIFFRIHTKVLKISSSSAEKTKASLDKSLEKTPNFVSYRMENCWKRRYLLFDKFDQGIKFDEESYISTPPQSLTTHLALRLKFTNLIHVYAGIGAYDVKLSNTCHNIIATDVAKTQAIYSNLSIYSIDNVDILENRCFLKLQNAKADAILITPPWGPSYSIHEQYDITDMNLGKLFSKALTICSNVIMVFPANISTVLLADILGTALYQESSKLNRNAYLSCSFEIQKVYFLEKIRFIVVYYGSQATQEVKLYDELNMIYEILGTETFKYRKITRHIREEYGMPFLLDLCLRAQATPGQTFDNLIKIIQDDKVIPDAKLKSFLNKNNVEEKKIDVVVFDDFVDDNPPQQQVRCSMNTNTYTNSFSSSYQQSQNITRQTININCSSAIRDSIKKSAEPDMHKIK